MNENELSTTSRQNSEPLQKALDTMLEVIDTVYWELFAACI